MVFKETPKQMEDDTVSVPYRCIEKYYSNFLIDCNEKKNIRKIKRAMLQKANDDKMVFVIHDSGKRFVIKKEFSIENGTFIGCVLSMAAPRIFFI